MKKINIIIYLLSTLLLIACEVTNFDLQDNNNELTAASADPNFILNDIQITFAEVMNDFSLNTDDVMRYESMRDTYSDIADNGSLNGEWEDIYNIRENAKIIESLAATDNNLLFHRGVAKILKAYSTATLVDYLGDVPYSQANDPNNFNPALDDDATIYVNILQELEQAINDINNATVDLNSDLFFDDGLSLENRSEKWIKVANTLKFRMLLNLGDTGAINNLLAEDNLISQPSDDFQFQYSTAQAPVNSRHPYFNRGYDAVTGQTQYIGNFFMWLLKDSKTVIDPRLRYYVFRQTDQNLTGSSCLGNVIFDFCYIGDFYWGRDHGDDRPRPNDRFEKTIYGVYPGGGAFDANNPSSGANSMSLGGAGIFPVMLSFYLDFLKAEATLSINADGNAIASLEAGIRGSMNKVIPYGELTGVMGNIIIEDDPTTPMIDEELTVRDLYAASQTDIDAYVTAVIDEYNVATSNEQRLNIVLREYYIAAFGNSIEAYNAYRRTGFPSNLQIPIINENTPFPRTFSLPSDAVDLNTSIDQRPITNQVFWDTNPAGFIQ